MFLNTLADWHTERSSDMAYTLPIWAVVLVIIAAIALFIFYLYLLQYIYKDAVKRELNGELWLIILLLAPIIGIIVYFIVRKSKVRV